jgi:hypothetical protein
MALEVGPYELSVPWPAVLGVGCGVDAGIAAAGADVALEGGLLFVVEDVAGCREPDDGVVLREIRRRERGGVLGRVDREVVGGAEALDHCDAVGNRIVAETRCLGEDQDVERGFDCVCSARHGQRYG